MPEVNQDEIENPSGSALGEAIENTPEVQQQAQEPQGTETGTPKQPKSQKQNVPFNEHPRFKEVIEEKNALREQNARLMEILQRQQQPQVQPQQLTTPQELGNTPEEREFWRMIDKRAEMIAEAKIKKVNPMLEAGVRELTNMKVQQFRQAHPDIKSNSPEELQIAQKINMGYLPEDAYRAVMWDKKVAEAEKQGNQVTKQKIEAKKQANVEQHSIPQGGTAPTNKKLSLRQKIEEAAKDLEF